MVHEMKIPSPGESIMEVEISQWLVSDGDIVSKDQTIAELDSDKATLDLPAETSGKISLKAEEGDTMSVGEVICLIDTSFASEINLDKEESTSNVVKEETIKSNPEEVTIDFSIMTLLPFHLIKLVQLHHFLDPRIRLAHN